MLNISICDYELQEAIYSVACKYEGFEVMQNARNGYWEQVDKGCDQGLEQAISDYILLKNDFDPEDGIYKDLAKEGMKYQVYKLYDLEADE